MIAECDLTDAKHPIDVDEVAAHAAGQGRGRQVVAAGVAVRSDSFGAERSRCGDEFSGGADQIVSSQYTNGGGDTGAGQIGQRQRRYP